MNTAETVQSASVLLKYTDVQASLQSNHCINYH